MLKKKLKTLACIFTLLVLISSLSFATTETGIEPRTTEGSTDETTPSLISENPEGDAVATSDDENTDTDESYHQDLVSDDLYEFKDTIEVDNLIDGNAYLFGNNVTISGQIGGDLFVIAKNVNFVQESYIYGNVFVIAENITIDGIVCDLYSVSQKLDITQNGIILRDMRSSAGSISLNGNVGRNTHLDVGNLSIGENAVIYGNLNYETSTAITVPEGVVNGDINFTARVVADTSNSVIDYVLSWITTILFTLMVFGLLLLFAPRFTVKAEEAIHKNVFATLGIGILSWIVILVVMFASLFLLATVVGASLAFVLGLLCLVPLTIANTLSIIAIASLLGNKVKFFGKAHNVLAIILVATVIWALALIPFYVGSVISALVMVFGLGLFVRSIFTKKVKEENNVVSE